MRRRLPVGHALLVGVLSLGWVACGPQPGTVASQKSGAPAVREYPLRGVIEALPAGAGGTLRIRHEPLPDLIGPTGEIEGMAAMTMPFPVAAGLDLAELAAGDTVAFTLQVDWDAARPIVISAIERLPPGTELELD